MKKLISVAVFLSIIAVVCSASAGTQTRSLVVSASVPVVCNIKGGSDIVFGPYDPTLTTPNDATGSIIVSCVKGTVYKTYVAGPRNMSDGGTNSIAFEIYSDENHVTVFPGTNAGGTNFTSTGIANRTITLYGRIPAGLDAVAASYSVTLTTTVDY